MSDKQFRNAITGEYVTPAYAAANPATTVAETVQPARVMTEEEAAAVLLLVRGGWLKLELTVGQTVGQVEL